MVFVFADATLKELYTTGIGYYPQPVIEAFIKRVISIKRAKNENDLRAVKGNHFEKLGGARKGEYSLRLNQGWRLIIEIMKNGTYKIISIKEITNHYAK